MSHPCAPCPHFDPQGNPAKFCPRYPAFSPGKHKLAPGECPLVDPVALQARAVLPLAAKWLEQIAGRAAKLGAADKVVVARRLERALWWLEGARKRALGLTEAKGTEDE